MNVRGFTLIEILVALLVVALGVLGLAGLQVRAQQSALEAQQHTQAVMLVHDMVERIRSTNDKYLAPCVANAVGDNTLGVGNAATFTCSGDYWSGPERHQVTADIAAWDELLKGLAVTIGDAPAGAMIGARGCVRYDYITELHTVVVAWQGLAATAAPADNCAKDLYGDDRLRRVLTQSFRIADLSE